MLSMLNVNLAYVVLIITDTEYQVQYFYEV